jgi:hypothetical protein
MMPQHRPSWERGWRGLGFPPYTAYLVAMALRNPRPRASRKADKLRSWRVTILRNRAHYLGDVEAADERAAEAAAVEEFKLSDKHRKRVVVQERD